MADMERLVDDLCKTENKHDSINDYYILVNISAS